jgi:DNA-binding LacI/PurR family transcriptional regulator
LEGFRKAVTDARLPVLDHRSLLGGMQPHAGYEFGRRLFNLPDPPTAVFCTNNKLLLGFVRAMNEAQVRCPEEISVVGFDDFSWTENFHPRLTTVAQPARELGRRAMQLLLDRVESKTEDSPGGSRQVLLKPELRIRESTARAATSAPRKPAAK